jgi:DNA-binding CsgD family transcriptional regulator
MSHPESSRQPIRPSARAHLAAAIPSLDWNRLLPPLAARQTVPNTAKARQTAPPHPPLQNKATPAAPVPPSHRQPTPPPDPARQTVPNSANARHPEPPRKTNPPRPLTPAQLRAAHLLVTGHSTTAIAATLQINRHTLAKWKRHPLFQQELRHLTLTSKLQTLTSTLP